MKTRGRLLGALTAGVVSLGFAAPAQAGLLGSLGTIVNNTTTTLSNTVTGVVGSVLPPPVTQALNIVPAGYDPLTPLEQLLGGKVGLGTVLQGVTCKPLTEVTQLAATLGLNPITDGITSLACNAQVLEYRFVTKFKKADGTMLERSQIATLGVPTLLNVDEDSAADMIGTLTLTSLNTVGLVVERFPGETAQLPVSVEAVLRDPTGSLLGRQFLAFGYDARDDRAPGRFTFATPIDTVLKPKPEFRFNLSQTTRGERIALIGSIFDGSVTQRINPAEVKVDYRKSPDTATITAAVGDEVKAALTTNRPGQTTISGRIVAATSEDRFNVDVQDMPSSLSLAAKTSGQLDVTYAAAARVAKLRGTIERRGAQGPTQALLQKVLLELDDVPTGLRAQQSGGGGSVSTTGGPVGRTKIGIANGEPKFLTDPTYVLLDDDGTLDSVSAQLNGVERATFTAGDAIAVSAKLAAGPLRARLVQPGQTLEAKVTDLPSQFDIGIDPEGRVLDYNGYGSGISKITVAGDSTTPFFARATKLRGTIEGIPATLNAALDTSSGRTGVVVNGGGAIGKVELVASNGAEGLPAGTGQGVVYRDVSNGEFRLAARINQLKKLSVATADALSLEAKTAGGPFSVDARTDDLEATGNVLDLPADTTLGFDQDDARLTFEGKDAAGQPKGIAKLTLDARSLNGALVGRADRVNANVEGIPASLALDLEQGGEGLAVNASNPIDLIELVAANRPAQADDLPAGGEQGAKYTDLANGDFVVGARVRKLKALSATLSQPLTVSAETAGGPFGIRATTDDLRAVGRIEDLPARFTASVDLDAGKVSIDGKAADGSPQGINRLTLDADSDDALFGRATHVRADIKQIPSDLALDLAQDGEGLALTANEPVGSIEVGAANRPVDFATDLPANGEQGAKYIDRGSDFVVGARVRQFKKVAADFSAPISVSTETEGGPFGVRVDTDAIEGLARIEDLPAKLDATLDTEDFRLSVDGHGQSIGTVAAEFNASSALFGRAKHVHALVKDIPANLVVDLAQGGDGVALTANEPVGLIEVAAASRPLDLATDLPVNDEQGAKFLDKTGEDFVVGARVRKLKSVNAAFGQVVQVATETEGGPFGVRVATDDVDGIARIEDLPAKFQAALDLDAGKVTVKGRDADDNPQGISRLTADVHSGQSLFGRASDIHADVRGISSDLMLDLAQDGSGANLEASEPVDLVELVAANHPLQADDLPAGDEQGAKYVDLTGGEFAIGARVRDFKKVAARFNDTIKVDTITQGGPFGLRAQTDDLRANARVEDLPAKLKAELDLDAGTIAIDGRKADDSPADDIGLLTIAADADEPLFGRATDVAARIRDLPSQTNLTFAQTGSGAALEANPAIGSVELVAADHDIADINDELPANDEQGATYRDTPSTYTIAARVRDLQKVVANLGDSIGLETQTAGGPFTVTADTPELNAKLELRDLPSHLNASFDPDGGAFHYDGHGQGMDELKLAIRGVGGQAFFGRATRLDATIKKLAANVDLTIDPEAPSADVSASSPIEELDLVATDIPEGDPVPSVPANEQGAVYHDKTGQPFVLAARLYDLQAVSFGLGGEDIGIDAKLRQTPFSVDLESDSLDAQARIEDLPAQTALGFDLANGAFTYEGKDADGNGAAVDKIDFEATSDEPLFGRAKFLKGTLEGVPAKITVGFDTSAGGAEVSLPDGTQLDKLTLQATDGVHSQLPPAQGVVYHDNDDEFVISAVVEGLRNLAVDFDTALGLKIKRAASSRFGADIDISDTLKAFADIQDLPADAELGLELNEENADEPGVLRFKGRDGNGDPQGIGTFDLSASTEEPIFGSGSAIQGHIEDLPSDVEISFGQTAGKAVVKAINPTDPDGPADPVGLIELAASDTPGQFAYPAAGAQGALLHTKTGDPFRLGIRIRDLEYLEADFSEAINLKTKTAGGPFFADVKSDGFNADAQILDLPETLDLKFDLEAGQVEYTGSSGIGQIFADVSADEPLFLGATAFQVDLHGVPDHFTLGLGNTVPEEGEEADLSSINLVADQPIDQIDVKAHSANREYPVIPAGQMGAIVNSQLEAGEPEESEELAMALRVYKLRELAVNLEPVSLVAKTEGNRVFDVDAKLRGSLDEQTGERGPDLSLKATIDKLPADVQIGLEDHETNGEPNGSKLKVVGSAPIDLVSLETNGLELLEGASNVKAQIEKLPQDLSITLPDTGQLAVIEAKDGNGTLTPIGQLRLAAASGSATLPADTYDSATNVATGDDTLGFVNTANDTDIRARLSGVKSLGLNLEPISLDAQLTGGRKLVIDATTANKDDDGNPTGTNTDLDATIDALPSVLHLGLEDGTPAQGGGSRLTWQASSAINQIAINADGIELLEGASKLQADIKGVPAAFTVALPDTETYPTFPLAQLGITGSQETTGGPRINELRLAAGDGTLPASGGNDRFQYIDGASLNVGVKLTNVKALAMKLDPISLEIGQEDTLNGGTKPIDLNASLPNDSGPNATVTGQLNKPSFLTKVGVTIPPSGSGQPNRLNFENGTAALPRSMGSITLNAQNLGSIPGANFSLANVPRRMEACLATDQACVRMDAAHAINPLPNYSGQCGQPSQNSTAAGVFNRPYVPQVSMYFDDFDTSGNSSAISSMITMNANIDLGTGGQPVSITNLRFHNLSLDFAQNGTTFAYKPIASISAGNVPRLYMYIDSQNDPFVMNSVKYPPSIGNLVMGTDSSPATALRRIAWTPGPRTSFLCATNQSIDTKSSGSLNCGGDKRLDIDTAIGNINAFAVPVFGDIVRVCG
ncbi:hypothetical protein [Conexibacter sp. SYSU D00693]|uniref:hypothetical protein n=1 Tax=Conexibacter sp. SYSU D00693 TaxID=2812560 RepID=UPI00196A7E20|nr:hypothetical protein [Conexibacter sp. SYSU D00693]